MARTIFIPRQTLITADWLNEVDEFVQDGISPNGYANVKVVDSATNVSAVDLNLQNGDVVLVRGRSGATGANGSTYIYEEGVVTQDLTWTFATTDGAGRLRRLGTSATGIKNEKTNVRWRGANGDNFTNDSTPISDVIEDEITDSANGAAVYFSRGTYQVSQITVDLSAIAPSVGRLNLSGDGNASQLSMRDTPSQNIFNIQGGTGQSFGMNMNSLRFGTVAYDESIAAAVLTTGSTTALDFQFYSNYINGCPVGFKGKFVSGIWCNNLFDFMPRWGILAETKEFRKIEIVSNHFYKTRQGAIYVDGSVQSDGVTPTTDAQRNDSNAAGHLVIAGNGFDRTLTEPPATVVDQELIVIDSADNFVIAANWFNGKSPGSTRAPKYFLKLTNCRNFVVGDLSMYYGLVGVLFEDCDHFDVSALRVRQGNRDGAESTGAVTFLNCDHWTANVSTFESQGTGVVVENCNDWTLSGRTDDAQFSGVVVKDGSRGTLLGYKVLDANMADSGTTSRTYGISIEGSGSAASHELIGCRSSVSDVSAGQKTNINIGAAALSTRISGGSVTSVRTGGVAIADAGTSTRYRGIAGWITKASGQATITNPATTVVVTHGLSVTPSVTQIRLTFNDASAGVTRVWPSTITSTQFTINLNATPTTTSLVGWSVDTEV